MYCKQPVLQLHKKMNIMTTVTNYIQRKAFLNRHQLLSMTRNSKHSLNCSSQPAALSYINIVWKSIPHRRNVHLFITTSWQVIE